MSENEPMEAAEETSFVDEILGGEDHSPESAKTAPDDAAFQERDNGEELIPEEDSEAGFDESADSVSDKAETPAPEKAPEAVPGPDESALKQEIESLQKRLHDTQSAFHKATGERAALQKELDELKAKKDNADDWFSNDDSEREKQLEADLKKSDAEIARVQAESEDLAKKDATARWDAAAAPVIKAHPDFEKVVYDELVPLLDPQKGNPLVRAAWDSLKDKSPAAIYEFAKNTLDVLEFQRDPKAYRERMRKEFQQENRRSDDGFDDDAPPVGKEGLDMLQSADMASGTPERGDVSFVDAIFG